MWISTLGPDGVGDKTAGKGRDGESAHAATVEDDIGSQSDDADAESDDDYDDLFDDDLGVPWLPPKGSAAAELDECMEVLLDTKRNAITDIVCGKYGAGEHLDHKITLCYRDEFNYDGSQVNECARRLTRAALRTHWKGPLLIYGMTKFKYSDCCVDLGPSDLSIALNGLAEHIERKKEGTMYSFKSQQPKKLQGVKV